MFLGGEDGSAHPLERQLAGSQLCRRDHCFHWVSREPRLRSHEHPLPTETTIIVDRETEPETGCPISGRRGLWVRTCTLNHRTLTRAVDTSTMPQTYLHKVKTTCIMVLSLRTNSQLPSTNTSKATHGSTQTTPQVGKRSLKALGKCDVSRVIQRVVQIPRFFQFVVRIHLDPFPSIHPTSVRLAAGLLHHNGIVSVQPPHRTVAGHIGGPR